MYFHMPGSMGIKMPNMAKAKVTNMAQDTAWYPWRGFDQPFTLDRRGGNVCCALLAGSGRTLLWLLPQQSICKREKGSLAGHGLPSHSQAWPGTPQGREPPSLPPLGPLVVAGVRGAGLELGWSWQRTLDRGIQGGAIQAATMQLWPTALRGNVAHRAQETKGHPPTSTPVWALPGPRGQGTAYSDADSLGQVRSMAQAII